MLQTMELLLRNAEVKASELEEIASMASNRQMSLNRLCEIKRLARQINPRTSRAAKTVVRINKSKIVDSFITTFKPFVGTWTPIEIVWMDGSDGTPPLNWILIPTSS